MPMVPIKRLLVANRSEIAIRVFRAASEMGIQTLAVYAAQDKLSLHRIKADEAYLIGRCKGPLEAYLSVDEMIRVAIERRADAIHPGYGLLSESPEFAEACNKARIRFIGPSVDSMRALGNKVAARKLAVACGVPVIPASGPLPDDPSRVKAIAGEIGYPLMIKASWGGGGRGMRPIAAEDELLDAVQSARREAKSAFGKDELYFEKLLMRARHVEVQILGDQHGNLVHLFDRDCSIQRRNQKIVERAPAPYVDDESRRVLCAAALRMGRAVGYVGAGTVEFLQDVDTGCFYFIEVNPRIQVEHTVTEAVTGIDIVKAQIRIAEGGRLGNRAETGVPEQAAIAVSGHAIQCRITTENPERDFRPDSGRITGHRAAMGLGIRIDSGTAYPGAVVTPHYDSLLEKITAWGPTTDDAADRMTRALSEHRIRGVATNLPFLESVIRHPRFRRANYTTRFIEESIGELDIRRGRDRGEKLLTWIAEVTINGHPETANRPRPSAQVRSPDIPEFPKEPATGTRQLLDQLGPEGLSVWMNAQSRVLITDTTMRDAHQSLLATRMRGYDIAAIAPAYASGMPQLFSLECWGGATFDTAMRFLAEDPWERLAEIRRQVPNILTQMLLRGANGVGYANYPDNVVRHFVYQCANAGIDVFRVFDCFNWVENMRVAIDAALQSGKLVEGAICYTGDILNRARPKYSLAYYLEIARELQSAGVHVLCVKDMAGVLKPAAADLLIKALKEEIGLPVHVHTHDTSGIAGATVLAAIAAGADAIDAAIDSMSGTTSQPCLGAIVEALSHGERQTGIDPEAIRRISAYWEEVRKHYAAFESEQRSGISDVYMHEIPGGQVTNLRSQAQALGLGDRWREITEAYRAANDLFGDIIKVTPTSKVVGDMALLMVSQGLSPRDVVDAARDVSFPASVVEMLRGDLGKPLGGWPAALQRKVLKGAEPISCRPGSLLKSADLETSRAQAKAGCGYELDDKALASYLMYPTVFSDFVKAGKRYGPVSKLPTSVFFYGMEPGEEITFDIAPGKTLVVALKAIGQVGRNGLIELFFELNGEPRTISVIDRTANNATVGRRKADHGDALNIAAPLLGHVSAINVCEGQRIVAGQTLLSIEAMKMQTEVRAARDGIVSKILVEGGDNVEAGDLLVELSSTQVSGELSTRVDWDD